MINYVMLGIVLGSSIWVLVDAKSIGVQKGQIKGIANMGPVSWFIVCLLLWIIGFPMYLAKRGEYKRVNGKPGGSSVATIVGLGIIVAYVVVTSMFITGDIKMSTADLQTQIEQSIRETWAKEPALAGATIHSFNLIHKIGNQYEGLLDASIDNKSEKLMIDVTYDGKQFMWQARQ